MTHFRSEQHQDPHRTMNTEQRSTRPTTVKRGNGATIRCDFEPEYDIRVSEEHHRGSEYQRVPGAQEPSPVKRQRASPSSSHSSSSRTPHRRNGRVLDKPRSSSSCKTSSKTLKMTELLSIKRELTGIKVQIDELLDCVDKMDQQRKDCAERPVARETSPHRGSVSSVERDSPEPGEASEEEAGYYHHYNSHTYTDRISPHSLDPEDDL